MKHAIGFAKTSTQNYQNFTDSENNWEALICEICGSVLGERIR